MTHQKKHPSKKRKDFRHYSNTSDVPSYEGEYLDKALHASLSKYFGWLSPASFSMSFFDWYSHFIISPGKHVNLFKKTSEDIMQILLFSFQHTSGRECTPCVQGRLDDDRFKNELWHKFPFNLYSQAFLICETLLNEATTDVRGVAQHHLNVVNFFSRQLLDIISPSNFPWSNPEVISRTYHSGGQNLVRGYHNYIEDISRIIHKLPPVGTEDFQVGINVAITPGKVIYRNNLIELIQYKPMTETVYREPILIVPAWIMKYYILDLSPHNSLVKYLIQLGHTVFIISWKNPDQSDRELGLDEYANLGVMSAIEEINKIRPNEKINAAGYCIGGTLLMIAAAALAGKSDERLNSITLFAAEVDFREAGELSLFIDESQITYLEDIMWEKGYLDGNQMSYAFSMLRSSELIWSRMVHDYLLGQRQPLFDIIAWDYDNTRLPYRMQSEYLRRLFQNNLLVQGKFTLNGKRVALGDINIPIFAVSTTSDHVAPWRSVYKIHLFTKTDVTFVLTTGGHNVGIVNPPNHSERVFQMMTTKRQDKHVTSDTWLATAPEIEGSWWPKWDEWLVEHNSEKTTLPSLGGPDALGDAPGTYVMIK